MSSSSNINKGTGVSVRGKNENPSIERMPGSAGKEEQLTASRFTDPVVPFPPPAADSPLAYLASLDVRGIRLGLGPVKRLLARLGNPQNSYGTVLIGGTNGKGSIAAVTASILVKSGYRVGLYTSPHLVDFRERIRVNGRMISADDVDSCIDAVRLKQAEDVTWFEFVTAMALLHFQTQDVQIGVLEVGMGGRLDATNVSRPMVSVISNISLEHRDYLGNRLEEIAREKAGIISKGTACITAARQESVRNLLADACRRNKARLYVLGKDFRVRKNRDGTFDYCGLNDRFRGISCPLIGRHQLQNTATALAVIERLRAQGMSITPDDVLQGVSDTRWEGRLEVVGKSPQILLDGAHNPAGIAALCRALREEFSYRKLTVVFGVLSDKDAGGMLGPLCRIADRLILTKPDVSRASSTEAVFAAARAHHSVISIFENSGDAVSHALKTAAKGDLICITGSLYLVGEVKKTFPFPADYVKPKLPK